MFIKPASSTLCFAAKAVSAIVFAFFLGGLPTAAYGASHIDFPMGCGLTRDSYQINARNHFACPALFRLRHIWRPNWRSGPSIPFERALLKVQLLGEAIGMEESCLMGEVMGKAKMVTGWVIDSYPAGQQVDLLDAFYQGRHDGWLRYGPIIPGGRRPDCSLLRFSLNCPWCELEPGLNIYYYPRASVMFLY